MISNIEDTPTRANHSPETAPAHAGVSTAFKSGELYHIAPRLLTIHLALSPFPRLSEQDAMLLRDDIQKAGRVLVPVLADSQLMVFDGRHRVELALELGLASLPVLIDDESDPVAAAMASCLAKRNLEKVDIALTLFEAHPNLIRDRKARQKSFLLNQKKVSEEALKKLEFPSFASLAEYYKLPAEYFSRLARIWDASTDEEWEQHKADILEKRKTLRGIYSGFRGKTAETPTQDKVDYADLIRKSFQQEVPHRLKHFGKLKASAQDGLKADMAQSFYDWPLDLLDWAGARMSEVVQERKTAPSPEKQAKQKREQQ